MMKTKRECDHKQLLTHSVYVGKYTFLYNFKYSFILYVYLFLF